MEHFGHRETSRSLKKDAPYRPTYDQRDFQQSKPQLAEGRPGQPATPFGGLSGRWCLFGDGVQLRLNREHQPIRQASQNRSEPVGLELVTADTVCEYAVFILPRFCASVGRYSVFLDGIASVGRYSDMTI